ncbi:MAG: DNRLRE domain-containing protein [bacterium]|nr:DNRLRE domain-containing protein [bacterium]
MKTVQLVTITALAAVLAMAFTAAATTVTKNPTGDTYVRGNPNADFNYGAAGQLLVGTHASVGPFHGLMRFDLTALTNAGLVVTNVILNCTSDANGADAGTNITINVYSLTAANADWFEGALNGGVAVGGQSCWNYKAGYVGVVGATSTNWAGSQGASTAGTDYDSTSTGAMNFQSAAAFTNAAQNALGGYLNIGIAVNTPNTLVSEFFRIRSRETSATATSLVIDYYVVPEPATLTLLGAALLMLRRRIC